MSLLSTIPPTSDLPPAERFKRSADPPKNVRGAGSADGLPQRRHGPVPAPLGGKPGRGSLQRSLEDQSNVLIINNPPDFWVRGAGMGIAWSPAPSSSPL